MSKLKIAVLDTAWPQDFDHLDREFANLLSRFRFGWPFSNPHLKDYRLTADDEHGGYVLGNLLCPLDHDDIRDKVEVRVIQTLPGGKFAQTMEQYAWAWEQTVSWIGSDPAIVNASWGAADNDLDVGGATSQERLRQIEDALRPMHNQAVAFLATCPNARVVFAAGNSGYVYTSVGGIIPDADQDVNYPSRFEPGIDATNQNPRWWVVGAHGKNWVLSPFSGDGPQVTLCAQGQGVRCLGPSGWRYLDGTSFAAPRVAGWLARTTLSAWSQGEDMETGASDAIVIADHWHTSPGGHQQQLPLGLHCWAHGYGSVERSYRRACVGSASEPGGWAQATTAWLRRRAKDVTP